MVKLTNRSMHLAINWVLKNGDSTSTVGKSLKVYQRRIQQLIKHYKETSEYPVLDMTRRPKTHLTDEQKQLIKQAYHESLFGVKKNTAHTFKKEQSANKWEDGTVGSNIQKA